MDGPTNGWTEGGLDGWMAGCWLDGRLGASLMDGWRLM